MISTMEKAYIEEHAYLPEHIPQYVTAVSETEPFLLDDFIAYVKKGRLLFIGYPLRHPFEEKRMEKALRGAVNRFKPKEVALIAPAISPSITGRPHPASDHYYRLDLSTLSVSQKLGNIIRRAAQELSVERVRRSDEEHREMVDDFLGTHPVEEATRRIFKRIPQYLSSSLTAWVFNVRNRRGELVGFDIAELGARHYAMYMFNFTSRNRYVPGASDLLLSALIQCAKEAKKEKLNLGLGINRGVTFFKRKWGGEAFCAYSTCQYSPSQREGLEELIAKL